MSTSNNDLTLDVGQANEFKLAARKAGYTNADIKAMCEGNMLSDFLKVIKGQAEIKIIEHLIDCDVAPVIPEGWSIEEHHPGGQFGFNATKVELHLTNKQTKKPVVGNDLRKELKGKAVLNANVLDYLLAHLELIPEDWKGKYVFFWGTIYRNSNGNLYVRHLNWDGNRWGWLYYWLDGDFNSSDSAAVASLT